MTLTIINILCLFLGGFSFAIVAISCAKKSESKADFKRLLELHERRAISLERIADKLTSSIKF
jgi:hypothetical protein